MAAAVSMAVAFTEEAFTAVVSTEAGSMAAVSLSMAEAFMAGSTGMPSLASAHTPTAATPITTIITMKAAMWSVGGC
jgi:hypothetical protein